MVKFRENSIFAYSAIPLFRYSIFRVLLTPIILGERGEESIRL